MCSPQPLQVGFPQLLQVIFEHIMFPFHMSQDLKRLTTNCAPD
jgi:hypothetical protein